MVTTVLSSKTTKQNKSQPKPPPMFHGDHLTRPEFEQRYATHPHLNKAELIESIVYIPSSDRYEQHDKTHSRIILFVGSYFAATPGTDFGDNATVRLDRENEVQPDAFLRLHESVGGQSRRDEDDYLEGAPELVVEVAASSAAYDLYEKLAVYRRNGVQEYLVLLAHEQETRWYQLVDGEYILMQPDEDGNIKSQVFPGLNFQSELFWADDLPGLLNVLQNGLAAENHQAFTAELQKKQK